MRRLWLIAPLLLLPPLRIPAQITPVPTHCPVTATKIAPHAFFARIHTAGEDGWRPGTRMTLDLRVKSASDREISALSLAIEFPGNRLLDRDLERVATTLAAGAESTIHYDGVLEIDRAQTVVTVVLTRIRYADGEIYDCSCQLGSAAIPALYKPVKPTTPSPVTPPSDDLSPPRLLESHDLDGGGSKVSTLTLSLVVEVDGSAHNVKIDSGTLGGALDQKAIDLVGTWIFTPPMLGDKAVAAKTTVQMTVGHP